MSFENLVEWLFATRPLGSVPQLGVADESKRALIWLPGKAAKPAGTTIRSDAAKYLGSTQLSFENHHDAMDVQRSWVCWAGVDIDGADNPSFKTHRLIELVCEATTDLAVSVRLSCGGRGVHVIQRLAYSVAIPAYPARGMKSSVLKSLNRPAVERVEAAGIHVCKSDCRMFWLWGGANAWVMQTDVLTNARDAVAEHVQAVEACGGEVRPALDGGAVDPFVGEWLRRLNVRPGPVYVGDVIARLRALGETVNTRSPMSGNGQVNGYIDVRPGEVGLWSYADGRTIWRIVDDERMLG